jgi:hypothetical protein
MEKETLIASAFPWCMDAPPGSGEHLILKDIGNHPQWELWAMSAR